MLLKLLFLSFSNVDFDTSRIYASAREDMATQDYYSQSAQQAPSTADILNNQRRSKDIQTGDKPPYPDFLK
jgi:hypothetical protein